MAIIIPGYPREGEGAEGFRGKPSLERVGLRGAECGMLPAPPSHTGRGWQARNPSGRTEGAGRGRRLVSSHCQPPWHPPAGSAARVPGTTGAFFWSLGTHICLEMNKGRTPGAVAGGARVRRPRATGAAHGGQLGCSHPAAPGEGDRGGSHQSTEPRTGSERRPERLTAVGPGCAEVASTDTRLQRLQPAPSSLRPHPGEVGAAE